MKVSINPKPAMTVHRRIMRAKKLVYVLVTKKPFPYKRGRSRILYIGTTQNGIDRIAISVAYRSRKIFSLRGARDFDVHVVSCKGRSGLKSWGLLERALIAQFRERHWQVPYCNDSLKNQDWDDHFEKFFRPKALKQVLANFEKAAR
jgi:hypothetical protein